MSTLYSLRVRPNWRGGVPWRDLTSTLDTSQLPSISISAEVGDVPLVASASDLSLTVSNAGGEWDSVFDAQRIIGTLPPEAGENVRAPAAHFGAVLLCRRATVTSIWQVVFFGFINVNSPRFDRTTRTCTFTAYAPGKLLEVGNAERVHRFHAFVEARPFVIPITPGTFKGALQHPQPPAGIGTDADGNPIPASNSWWRLYLGATDPVIPLGSGDQFAVVRASAWIEGMQTIRVVDKTFTVAQVIAGADGNLYFSTTEAGDDEALALLGNTSSMELLNPWYRSRDWRALIDGSDGNPNCLKNEANAALVTLGVDDVIGFSIASAPELPLLPATAELVAQPIYQPDVVPGCMGVSYGRFTGVPFLAHQQLTAAGQAPVTAKPDILLPDSTAAPFNVFPKCAANIYNPALIPGYLAGPDDGKPVRLISSTVNDQLDATPAPDYATDDLPIAGQDLHQFDDGEIANAQFFDSTHWSRAPSSWRSGSEPKRLYRAYARGRYRPGPGPGTPTWRKSFGLAEVTTGDEGATWTIVSSDHPAGVGQDYPDDGHAVPLSSRSSRPSIKVFELNAGAFLYVWVNPILAAAYCHESATDNVGAASLMAATPFLGSIPDPLPADAPILSSSAVHWPDGSSSGVTLFFSDRADRTKVDVYFYAPGPTWTPATVIDNSGLGLPANLLGADWINAVADTSRTPARLYVMVGPILYAMHVSFAAGTLTIAAAQAIPIDQINYDPIVESTAAKASNTNAIAWLTCPVVQAFAGEPDYTASSDALIVGTSNAVYILSNVASNIVDIADFEGLSVAGALAELIVLRAYFMLTAADQSFVTDPRTYTPASLVTFYARLETAARKGVIDLVGQTEAVDSGTWLQNFQSVQVQNSKLAIGPAYSSTTLTNLDGVAFTINPPRNAPSVALAIDNPFLATVSFAALLANLYAQEFVVPRPGANVIIRDPYSRGLSITLLPGKLARYLVTPPDSITRKVTQQGRILTIDYALDTGLVTLGIA